MATTSVSRPEDEEFDQNMDTAMDTIPTSSYVLNPTSRFFVKASLFPLESEQEQLLEEKEFEPETINGVQPQPLLFYFKEKKFCSSFILFPPEAYDSSIMRIHIELAGAFILTGMSSHTICLRDENYLQAMAESGMENYDVSLPEDQDVFSSNFIWDSIVANKLVDLNKYRLGTSKFEPYDANQVVTGDVKWSELKRIPIPDEVQRNEEVYVEVDPNAEFMEGAEVGNVIPDVTTPSPKDLQKRSIGPVSSSSSSGSTKGIIVSKPRSSSALDVIKIKFSPSKFFKHRDQMKKATAAAVTPVKDGVSVSPVLNSSTDEDISSAVSYASSSSAMSESDDSASTKTQNSKPIADKKTKKKKQRKVYLHSDDVKILKLLKERNWHKFYKGREMWKTIARMNICAMSHTWQSLKEHFKQQILPNLSVYHLSNEELDKFRLAKLDNSFHFFN